MAKALTRDLDIKDSRAYGSSVDRQAVFTGCHKTYAHATRAPATHY